MENRISKIFYVPLNCLPSVKTAKSSLARGHMGGPTGGTWSWDPGPPPWSIYKKKVLHDPGPDRKQTRHPPPPPSMPSHPHRPTHGDRPPCAEGPCNDCGRPRLVKERARIALPDRYAPRWNGIQPIDGHCRATAL